MRNLLLTIRYDGRNYHGWQIQKNALAVQDVFQQAMRRILGDAPDLKGCSRTDSGVHAYEFCISLKIERNIPCERFQAALNHFLPPDIAVTGCREVPLDFHARYSCAGKEYVYKIWNHPVRDPFLDGRVLHYWYPLKEDVLDRAAHCFLGRHDFTSFCTCDSRERGDFCRCVTKSEVRRDGNLVTFTVAADGFLYNMVRIMTGTLLRVAEGKFQPEDIVRILESKNRKAAGPTAPPHGLYLQKVFYSRASLGLSLEEKREYGTDLIQAADAMRLPPRFA